MPPTLRPRKAKPVPVPEPEPEEDKEVEIEEDKDDGSEYEEEKPVKAKTKAKTKTKLGFIIEELPAYNYKKIMATLNALMVPKREKLVKRGHIYNSWATDDIVNASEYKIYAESPQKRLQSYAHAVIKTLPKNGDESERKQILKRIGDMWDHHVENDYSYKSDKTIMRQAVGELVGLSGRALNAYLKHPEINFDRSERTIKANKKSADKAAARQHGTVNISLEYIERVMKQMKADIESGKAKYDIVPVLLTQLATGARWVEAVQLSMFHLKGKKKAIGEDGVESYMIEQQNVAKHFKDGKDERGIVVVKPALPYVDTKYILEKLDKWRSTNVKEDRIGQYLQSNETDFDTVKLHRQKGNMLLQSRYFPGIASRKVRDKLAEPRIKAKQKLTAEDQTRGNSSHMLRAIYALASFTIFHEKNDGQQGWIREKLGHYNDGPGSRYSDIKIVAPEKDDNMKLEKFPEVKGNEKADPEESDEEDDTGMNVQDDQQEDEEDKRVEADAPIPARRPPLKAREDNLAPAAAPNAELAAMRAELAELRIRVQKSEHNQAVLTKILKGMMAGFSELQL